MHPDKVNAMKARFVLSRDALAKGSVAEALAALSKSLEDIPELIAYVDRHNPEYAKVNGEWVIKEDHIRLAESIKRFYDLAGGPMPSHWQDVLDGRCWE